MRRMSPRGNPVYDTGVPCVILLAFVIAIKHAFDEYNGTRILMGRVRVVPNQLIILINLLRHLIRYTWYAIHQLAKGLRRQRSMLRAPSYCGQPVRQSMIHRHGQHGFVVRGGDSRVRGQRRFLMGTQNKGQLKRTME